jgi:hypothetical protein
MLWPRKSLGLNSVNVHINVCVCQGENYIFFDCCTGVCQELHSLEIALSRRIRRCALPSILFGLRAFTFFGCHPNSLPAKAGMADSMRRIRLPKQMG